MDYEAEQAMELEALEAIFPEDLEEYDGNLAEGWSRHGKTWVININPAAEVAGDEDDSEPELQMQLVFAHTPTYPDEAPCVRLRSVKGLSDADLQEATAELQRHIEESMGMAMIYNLVTAAQEWLASRLVAGPGSSGLDPDAEEKRRRDEEEAARAAARAHGTHVTVEGFNAWRKKFEAELALQKASLEGSKGTHSGRLTGKAWFLQQMAAGKVQSGSEEEEEDAEFEVEEGDSELGVHEEEEEEDVDFDEDDDDEDDEGMLEEYLQSKAK